MKWFFQYFHYIYIISALVIAITDQRTDHYLGNHRYIAAGSKVCHILFAIAIQGMYNLTL